jgi:hypothetical protein
MKSHIYSFYTRKIKLFLGWIFLSFGLYHYLCWIFNPKYISFLPKETLLYNGLGTFTSLQSILFNSFFPLLVGSILLVDIEGYNKKTKFYIGVSLLIFGVTSCSMFFINSDSLIPYSFERCFILNIIPLIIGSILMINLGVEKTDKLS